MLFSKKIEILFTCNNQLKNYMTKMEVNNHSMMTRHKEKTIHEIMMGKRINPNPNKRNLYDIQEQSNLYEEDAHITKKRDIDYTSPMDTS
jgi:hypothetical protein